MRKEGRKRKRRKRVEGGGGEKGDRQRGEAGFN